MRKASAAALRQPAHWMMQFDDRILELIDAEGPHRIASLVTSLGIVGPGFDRPMEYTLFRCRDLRTYGLIEYDQQGYFCITEKGRRYLRGDIDPDGLSPVTEDSVSPSREQL